MSTMQSQPSRPWAAGPRVDRRSSVRLVYTLATTVVDRKGAVVAPRSLYLYEVIDIVGQGQYDYMEHLWKDPVQEMPDMDKLQGSFYVCSFGGGRWPQVINIWDVGPRGYTSWGFNVDRTNLKRRRAFYTDWWQQAYEWRTGGFDRLCAGVPGSPTTPELAEKG